MPKRAGISAVCRALSRFIHPSKHVKEVLTNCTHNHCLTNLVVIRKEMKKVNNKIQMCIIFCHDDFPNEELYCCMRYCRVVREGAREHFFSCELFPGAVPVATCGNEEACQVAGEVVARDQVELPTNLSSMTATNEDIETMIALGFDVDDDNEPAPENILDVSNDEETSSREGTNTDSGLCDGQSLGWSGFCDRKTNGFGNTKPRMKGLFAEVIGATTSYLSLFLLFFQKRAVGIDCQRNK